MLAGMAGMGEDEFWRCSLRYLYNRLEGYAKAREMEAHLAYEVARYNAMLVLSPNVKKGKALKITDLGKFDWELTEKEKEAMKVEAQAVDAAKRAELAEKAMKAIEEGRVKWETVKPDEIT